MKALALVFTLLAAGSAGSAFAQAVNAGDLLIYRVGTNAGTDVLSNAGNSVFVDEWTTSGTYVRTYATTIFASGTATSEGMMSSSPTGQYVAFAGYNSAAAGLASTASATVNRSVGVLNAATGTVTKTNFSDFSTGNNPRSAVTTNGTDLWMAGGAGGVRYGTTAGGTSTQLSTTVTNIRDVQIVNGQLYASDSSGSAVRVGTVGTGTPTTSGQTITNLNGFPTAGSPYSFFFAKLGAGSVNDTLYVADDTAGGGQIQKYSLVGTSWILNGNVGAAGVRGLTGTVTGGTVQLFGTTGGSGAAGAGSLYTFLDTTGYNAMSSGLTATTLATNFTLQAALGASGSSYAFRGVAIAIPEPSTYALILGTVGFAGVLVRRRRNIQA